VNAVGIFSQNISPTWRVVTLELHPSEKRFWYYQACVTLSDGRPFLVFAKLQKSCSNLGVRIPTINIMNAWASIILRFGETRVILVADSYYLSQDAKDALEAQGIKYCVSVDHTRFKYIDDLVDKSKVTKPSEWAGIWCEETKNLYVYNHDVDVGKKYNLSNCFVRKERRNNSDGGGKFIVPGYTH
jgi:hypothetical protein